MQLCAWANDGSDDLFVTPDHVFPYAVAQTCGGGALYARWFQSDGAQGKQPPARLRDVMEKWKRGLGVPPSERMQLGKDIWKILAEDVYVIGVVGLGPAQMGLRVAKVTLGNVPARQANNTAGMMPSNSRPVTFYWRTP
jgi:hypothetical protein